MNAMVARAMRDRETLEAVRIDEGTLYAAALRQACTQLSGRTALTQSEQILWFLRTQWPVLHPELRDALAEAQLVMAAREDGERPRVRELVGEWDRGAMVVREF